MSTAADIFLSYSRDDRAAASHFAEGFERTGFSVWWDVTLNAGEDYDQVTEQALRGAKAVVVLWSKKSVASRWVRTEATIALQSKTLVPVMIEPCQRPIMFELTQTADLCHWNGDSSDPVWITFLSDVQRFVHRDVSPAASAAQVSESATLTPASCRTPAPTKTATAIRSTSKLAWGLFALSTLIAATLAFPTLQHLRETPPPPPLETRVDIVTPPTDAPTDFALSPDGRQIVFVATGEGGVSQLWLRSLATATAQPLVGTEGAANPFWAPDGHAIGFITAGALKRIDAGGGEPQTLVSVGTNRGASWGADNTIIFAALTNGSLSRVSASGGEVTAATTLAPQEQSHRYPHLLPDGRRFLFYAQGASAITGIYLGNLDGSVPVRLTAADSAGIFLPGGWLLWTRAGTLTAQRLDVDKAVLTGELVTLANGVVNNSVSLSGISAAATGLIAYRAGSAQRLQLTWVDRSGAVLGTLGAPDDNLPGNPRVSPDGRRVVVNLGTVNSSDLWLLDGARTSRFTFEAGADQFPVWSPDGSRIAFRSNRSGAGEMYQKDASGAGAEALLVESDLVNTPQSWSADGRFLLYTVSSPQTDGDLWVLPMTGAATPAPLLQTPFRETWPAFSPDGRWVAYHSDASGRLEVYVRAFVAPDATTAQAAGGQWQISTEGGAYAVWSPDGRELYYLDTAGNMMAVPFSATADTFAPESPVLLFPTRIRGGGVDVGLGRNYDVAPDGRFLISTLLDDVDAPITLIQNWNPER